jgi:hypothetical protein
MPWKPLELIDKPIFDRFLEDYPIRLSDYPFTNLYMWNELRHYSWQIIEGFLCIKTDTYLYPIGEGNPFKLLMSLKPFKMRAIPEEALQYLKGDIVAEENRFDYVYAFHDLLHLSGNLYQAKRNLIHQFIDNHPFEYQKIDDSLLPKIIEFTQKLPLLPDIQPILRALNAFNALKLQGGALIVEGQVVAFSFYEKITFDTVVIHAEKAVNELKGAYQTMNQQLLLHMEPCQYINREESLGIANLIKAKESYHPVKLLKKFAMHYG